MSTWEIYLISRDKDIVLSKVANVVADFLFYLYKFFSERGKNYNCGKSFLATDSEWRVFRYASGTNPICLRKRDEK